MIKNKIASVKGIAMLGALVASIAAITSFTNQALTTDTSAGNPNCMPLSSVKDYALFHVKTPKYLPAGYGYQCGTAEKHEATLIYWDQDVDKSTYGTDKAARDDLMKGAIALTMIDEAALAGTDFARSNGTQAAIDDYEDIRQVNGKLTPSLIKINGALAWGHESAKDAGEQSVIFPEGDVITHTYDVPAKLRIYEEGKIIHLQGNVTLAELVNIAESLE
jgi:hypothetical protein